MNMTNFDSLYTEFYILYFVLYHVYSDFYLMHAVNVSRNKMLYLFVHVCCNNVSPDNKTGIWNLDNIKCQYGAMFYGRHTALTKVL